MKILVVIILILTAYSHCLNVDDLFKQIVNKEHLFIKKTNRALKMLSHIDFWNNGKRKRNLVEELGRCLTNIL